MNGIYYEIEIFSIILSWTAKKTEASISTSNFGDGL